MSIKGTAWEMFAIMGDGEELQMIVAKNPNQPQVVDITDQLESILSKKPGGSPPPANMQGLPNTGPAAIPNKRSPETGSQPLTTRTRR